MTTVLQIAKDRTTKNKKAKEHALKNAEKWTDSSSGEEKKIRTEPVKARAGWKTAGEKRTKGHAHQRERSPTTR